MEVEYEIVYAEVVVADDIPRLTKTMRVRIRTAIEQKLTMAPETFGRPLRRSLKAYRKLRVGDYRVVYRIESNFVKIFVIQHRSIVYETANKRLSE